jgi:hypothetical protein
MMGSTAVHPAQNDSTFWYGPYVDLPAGQYTVTYRLMIGPAVSSSDLVLFVCVTNQTPNGREFFAALPVFATDFPGPNVWTDISLNLTLNQFVVAAEFPGLYPTSAAVIYFGGVTVTVDPGVPA